MALLPETRAALARYDAWLARNLGSPERLAHHGQRVRSGIRAIGRRIRNMILGVFAVALLAFVYGTRIAPLGFLGVVVMVLGMITAMVVLAGWPAQRKVEAETFDSPTPADLPAAELPRQMAAWLSGLDLSLPADLGADMQALVQDLGHMDALVRHMDADSPAADDVRRLLGQYLPRLVESYAAVPLAARSTSTARGHFREGLGVIRTEIERLSGGLASARLKALETEERFLKSRYGDINDQND